MDAQRFNEIAEAIKSRCRADFPDSYAGMWSDHLDQKMIIFRGADTMVDTAVRAAFPDAPVSFRRGGHDPRVLEQLRARIHEDHDWRRRGVQISVLGVLPDGCGVTVGTPQAATATAEIEERYGAEYVIVERASFTFFPPFRVPKSPPGD